MHSPGYPPIRIFQLAKLGQVTITSRIPKLVRVCVCVCVYSCRKNTVAKSYSLLPTPTGPFVSTNIL